MSSRFRITMIVLTGTLLSAGCISDTDYVQSTPIDRDCSDFIATNQFLYTIEGSVACLDWDGNLMWESPSLGGRIMAFLGDAIAAKTYDRSRETGGVALLTLGGEILWQRETGLVGTLGVGASHDLIAVGSTQKGKPGILWAFSREGDVLWTYTHSFHIDQVIVAPDSSCVVFTDTDNSINCVRQGELVWSQDVGHLYIGRRIRTIAFAPDSSYLVFGSEKGDSKIVAYAPEGTELWSQPIEDYLSSVAISQNSQYIVAGSKGYLYKIARDGTFVWVTRPRGNIQHIALTPKADYIVIGGYGIPYSPIKVLNGEGTILWKARSSDNIFAVAISPDGKHVAFGDRLDQLYLFSNPPNE